MVLLGEFFRVKKEKTVFSLGEFLNEPKWFEAFCKRHPEYDPNDNNSDIYEIMFGSDMCEIEAILEADHRIFTVDCLENRSDTYFLIREWEKEE